MKIEKLIIEILCAIIFVAIEIYVGNRIYKEKVNLKKIGNIIIIVLYMAYLICNAFVNEKMLKIILTYAILMMLYKLLYKKNWNKSLKGSLIIYMITLLSESIVVPTIITMMGATNLEMIQDQGIIWLGINVAIGLVDLIIYKLAENRIIKIIWSIEKEKHQQEIVAYSLLLVTATMIVNKLNITQWTINLELIINIVIFIVFLAILMYVSKKNQENERIQQEYNKIKSKYKEAITYTNINDEVLEEYRMKSHEFQNKLVIIRGMVKEDNKELIEYLDNQIEKTKKYKYSWANEVKYIQSAGLKGLINYKIIEMKNQKIRMSINISKDVKKFKFKEYDASVQDDLYSIVGVYLDNAREAAIISKEQRVAIDIYIENKDLVIMIGNTYQGEIDLNKIGEYNYSTKGESRGVGLHLVKDIIAKEERFSSTSEIRNSFFVQILKVKSKQNIQIVNSKGKCNLFR